MRWRVSTQMGQRFSRSDAGARVSPKVPTSWSEGKKTKASKKTAARAGIIKAFFQPRMEEASARAAMTSTPKRPAAKPILDRDCRRATKISAARARAAQALKARSAGEYKRASPKRAQP